MSEDWLQKSLAEVYQSSTENANRSLKVYSVSEIEANKSKDSAREEGQCTGGNNVNRLPEFKCDSDETASKIIQNIVPQLSHL